MITKDRIYALAREGRPESAEETTLIRIVEAFDYFGWRSASPFKKQILLERGAKVMAEGLLYPVFEFTIEMAAWQPEPARKSFFSRFRKAA